MKDRSAAIALAWTIGIGVVTLFCFYVGGRMEPVAEASKQPPVQPAPLRAPKAMTTDLESSLAAVMERAQRDATVEARSKVRAVQNSAACYSDRTHQYLVGMMENGSDRTVSSWKVSIRFLDADGLEVDRATLASTKPIRPHGSVPFKIRHPHVLKAVRGVIAPDQVEFQRAQ